MEATMKTYKIALMVDDLYQTLELWYPYYRFKEEGYQVDLVAGEKNKEYHSKEGYPCVSTVSVREAKVDDYDCLVIPGGFAPDMMRRDEHVLRFVNAVVDRGKIIASICHGASVLCSTRILKGKKATGYIAIKDDITNAGATYVDSECVVDGKLITSRVPDDLPAFCSAVIKELAKIPVLSKAA
jgi:protease I